MQLPPTGLGTGAPADEKKAAGLEKVEELIDAKIPQQVPLGSCTVGRSHPILISSRS